MKKWNKNPISTEYRPIVIFINLKRRKEIISVQHYIFELLFLCIFAKYCSVFRIQNARPSFEILKSGIVIVFLEGRKEDNSILKTFRLCFGLSKRLFLSLSFNNSSIYTMQVLWNPKIRNCLINFIRVAVLSSTTPRISVANETNSLLNKYFHHIADYLYCFRDKNVLQWR